MTAAELEALEVVPEGEFDWVRCWRFEELLRAGYDEEDATEIAFLSKLISTMQPTSSGMAARAGPPPG
jgi:alkylhydroperoxidase family enzyme